ncbi:MAG: 2-C-methyl-D-erythritol 2,4-cyclodiphosphate synthase [Phycisphaerales bacterium]|jgi:2-C-methyl-D-erythritol 2,4-cyclodiphosphate synthase|nr:2-C-methyl-D-erythritol 2,4-cyclodiphosphate synthase [Phycisphaerales bacterium]
MADTNRPRIRIGHGWDLHRLEKITPGTGGSQRPLRPLVIGGVELAFPAGRERGVAAHSDGDVLLHALTDAILGALGEPDIGQLFPDNDQANAARASADFVREAVLRMSRAGYTIGNVDATVVLQEPRIGARKDEIRVRVAGLLGVEAERVNVKGKSHERVDAVGEGRAVEAHVVVLLEEGIGASRHQGIEG